MSKQADDGAAGFIINQSWLDMRQEDVIDPALQIIDAHQHYWEFGSRYFFEEALADATSGHNVIGSVHVQCGSMYSADVEPAMAPVGETEFINGIAARSASGAYGPWRAAAGIVGFADLTLGDAVEPVLAAHLAASSRFRGLRHIAIWDADSSIQSTVSFPKGLLLDHMFRNGLAKAHEYDLSFETWIFHPQIDELADLARAFPDMPVILNHIGTPLDMGPYAGKGDDVFQDWRRAIQRLAACPNAYVKLSGLAMHFMGFDLECREVPASSEELATLWRPYVESCIEAFGPQRCMFASNFPVEKLSCSYRVLWNAFKRIVAPFSHDEQSMLFAETARQVYRLELPDAAGG